MRPFNHQKHSSRHSFSSHCPTVRSPWHLHSISIFRLRFPASKHVCGWHLSLSSFSLRHKSSLEGAFQLHSSRRPWHPTEPNVSHQNSWHLTNQRTPTWSAACCSNVAKRLSKHCRSSSLGVKKLMLDESHEHTGRIWCTWGTACVAHVSRCLRVVFPETSWTFQRLLGHFCKGGVGISYPHASGLLLAQLHSHFQTSKCRHLSARQLTKHCEKVERRWKKCLFTLFSIANAVTSIEI